MSFSPNSKPRYVRNKVTGMYERNYDDAPTIDFNSMADSLDELMSASTPYPSNSPSSTHISSSPSLTRGPAITERNASSLTSKSSDRGGGGGNDRYTDRNESKLDRNSPSSSERLSERSSDRPAERSSTRNFERNVDRDSERKQERNADRQSERTIRSSRNTGPLLTTAETKDREQTQLSRQILHQAQSTKRSNDRLENLLVSTTRTQRQLPRPISLPGSFSLLTSNEKGLGLDIFDGGEYVSALMMALRNDDVVSPVPDDFGSGVMWKAWRSRGRSFQEVIVKLIKYRFLTPSVSREKKEEKKEIRMKVVQATDLKGKEGRVRECHCIIKYGNLKQDKKNISKFQTDRQKGLSPIFDQSMTIEVKDDGDLISVSVFDGWDKKEHFMGEVRVRMGDVCTGERLERWFDLVGMKGKPDKYVGGRLLLIFNSNLGGSSAGSSGKKWEDLQTTLQEMQVDYRALYDVLIRNCLVLDLFTPKEEGREDILSEEALTMIRVWTRSWDIHDDYQYVGYLKAIFHQYREDKVSVSEVLKAVNYVYCRVRKGSEYGEWAMLNTVLKEVKEVVVGRIVGYKEVFKMDRPKGALESTIFLLRMCHIFPSSSSKGKEKSPREELKVIMTEACIKKFQHFQELTTPLNSNDLQSVMDGILKLGEMVMDEIEMDHNYFQTSFAQELDIVRLTSESHLKHYKIILEDNSIYFEGIDDQMTIFSLIKMCNLMNSRYSFDLDVVELFTPFLSVYFNKLKGKVVGWVKQALLNNSIVRESSEGTSITDIFTILYQELSTLTDLEWDAVFLGFGQIMGFTIESYCDQLLVSETEVESTVESMKGYLMNSKQPVNIQVESCGKLRNISYAMVKLRELYRMVGKGEVKSYSDTGKQGSYTFTIVACENLSVKSPTYVVIEDGSELVVKTRATQTAIEETHTLLLKSVSLNIKVYAKNLLSSDDLVAQSRLSLDDHPILKDHHVHDLDIHLNPQGSLLLRIAMDGGVEDVDYHFKRANEKLIRSRDSLLRLLTIKLMPYLTTCITKVVKENEPTTTASFFTSLISNVEYTNKTPAGDLTDQNMSKNDAQKAMDPLFEYLEPNLAVLCEHLPMLMSQATLERIWNDLLVVYTDLLLPPLYGALTKLLHTRQISFISQSLTLLLAYMHADGEELGLSKETLENERYRDLKGVLDVYECETEEVKRVYRREKKPLVLRLLRVKDKDFVEELLRKGR